MYYIRALIYDFLYWCLYEIVLEALRSVLEMLKSTPMSTQKTCVKEENKAGQTECGKVLYSYEQNKLMCSVIA